MSDDVKLPALSAPQIEQVGKTPEEYIAEVDLASRARIAALRARGLSEYSVAEILMLTPEHVKAVETTEEYRNKFGAEADRIIQEQIDRDEGWDGIENAAIEGVLSIMRFNKDPKFLLMTAQIANRAERRVRSRNVKPIIVDAAKIAEPEEEGEVAPTAKIIVLNLNKTYINNQTNNGAIDVNARAKEIPLKQSDTPAPKLVEGILIGEDKVALEAERIRTAQDDPLKRMFQEAGLVFDEDPKRGS